LFQKDPPSPLGWVLAFTSVSIMAFALGHRCGAAAEEAEHE
jgi:hypothetical protein